MINKKKALFLLSEYGDAVIDFTDSNRDSIVCTTDFNNKYIKRVERTKRFPLKGNILVFNWTDYVFEAIPIKIIKKITPLANILGNK